MKSELYILIFLGIVLIILFNKTKPTFKEHFIDYNQRVCDPPELLKQALDERKLSYNKTETDYYIPCTYDTCEADVVALANKKSKKKLYLIDGCDVLASKLDLWRKIKKKFGKDADKYMPRTYILEELGDKTEFINHFDENYNKRPGQMYVLKNYNQRQLGIKLSRDKNEILSGHDNGWYIVQDYVYDPYIIANRKINFRYYLLITCIQGKVNGYVFDDGFVYYTPEYYDENDMEFDKHITTGYIDRDVYVSNPLTQKDFRKYLENIQPGSSKIWDKSANDLLKHTMEALDKEICTNNALANNVRAQLFGCDLAPDSKLGVKLMEINKGPDIGAKDDRDRALKLRLQRDILVVIEDNTTTNTGFSKIY